MALAMVVDSAALAFMSMVAVLCVLGLFLALLIRNGLGVKQHLSKSTSFAPHVCVRVLFTKQFQG